MLAELLPLIVGAALLPAWMTVVLLLLRGEGGVARAAALIGGAILVRIGQGVVFGLIFGAVSVEQDRIIAETLLLVVGVLFLVTALRKLGMEEDTDAPPPRWIDLLSRLRPSRTFGLGALFMLVAVKQWVFTLSAIAIIEGARPGFLAGTATYLFFVAASASVLVLPIIISAIAPAPSARAIEAAYLWMERNNRVLTIAVSLVFGIWFTWWGATELIAQLP